MSGLEVGAAIFALITGTIEIIHQAIEIYGAVNDKSGIPRALKKVSEKLPSLEEILKNAEAQYKSGILHQIDKETWVNVKQELEHCKQTCQELHDLLHSAYPKADSSKSERLWKGTKTALSGKGRTAEALLKEIWEYLTLLAERQIISNTALLGEIKSLVEELCPASTHTNMQNTNGDNIGTLHGDKVSGSKNVNSGSGYQFMGRGGTYNIGGAYREETQYALLSSRHRDHKPFSRRNSRILRTWISNSHEQSQGLVVSDYDGVTFESMYRRISDDDPIAMYNRLSSRKLANTTGWLVNHKKFKSWLSGPTPWRDRLWLSGKVGSGKSTLVTTVIHHCRAGHKSTSSSALLMYFFQSEEDTALSFLESLTKQLIAALVCIDVPCSTKVLSALETAYGNNVSRPDIAQVFDDLVLPLCRLLPRIILVIDGIDECSATEVTLVWRWLNKLLKHVEAKVLMTSEDQANIPLHLEGFDRIQIAQQHNQIDIDIYIDEQVASKSGVGQVFCDESLREEVKANLRRKADGMFLWIHLVLKIILEYCETPAQVRKAVEELPPDLQAIYALCLKKRRDSSKPINASLFLWVCAAPEPLNIIALRELLAMDLETGQVNTDEMPFFEGLLKSGAGLVTTDVNATFDAEPDERQVVPIHSTVRHFVFSDRFRCLLSEQNGQEPWSLYVQACSWRERTFRSALGSLCLFYIKKRTSRELETKLKPSKIPVYPPRVPWFIPKSFVRQSPKPVEMVVDFSSIGRNPSKVLPREFLSYAIENWLICNKDISSDGASLPWIDTADRRGGLTAMENLFEEIALERNDSYGIHPWPAVAGTLNSHLSQMFAYAVANNHLPLMQVVKRNRRSLPKGIFDSPLAQHDQMRALHVAAKKGSSRIISELASICDLNVICPTTGKHVLHFLAEAGHEACLKALLTKNLKWNARDKEGRTALLLAIMAGHDGIVEALLETGNFDVNEKDRLDRTLLWWAARKGNDRIAQALLGADGIEIDAADHDRWTPLLCATYYGHHNIVQPLLETGKADVTAVDKSGLSPLLHAVNEGHAKVVQLLLKTGKLDVNGFDAHDRTALWWALYNGHDEVIKVLLETSKAWIDQRDERGQTKLLLWAASNGYDQAVQHLLETGKADISATNDQGLTPLHMAASHGYDKIVQLLLSTGKADTNKENYLGSTPLSLAVSNGHHKVVWLMLWTGKADINKENYLGSTPLLSAISHGQDKMVRLMLKTGKADINQQNYLGSSPLSLARSSGHDKIVKLFLDTRKFEMDAADDDDVIPEGLLDDTAMRVQTLQAVRDMLARRDAELRRWATR